MVAVPRHRKLSLTQRAFIAIFGPVTQAMIGFRIPFIEDYVRTYGITEFVKWSNEGVRLIRELQKRYGEAEGHMLVSISALWCGCRWCSVAHMYIGNLTLFKREGALGPFDELELPNVQEMNDDQVLEVLDRHLVERWAALAPLARRMYRLRTGEALPKDDTDDLLVRTNAMWEWIIECTIMAFDYDPETIPAWDGFGRSHKLKARYREARRMSKRSLTGRSSDQ